MTPGLRLAEIPERPSHLLFRGSVKTSARYEGLQLHDPPSWVRQPLA